MTGEVNLIFTLGDTSPPSPLEKFLGQALPKYVREPELVDRGFSCEIHPEWGEFPAVQSLPSDSPVRAWLEGTELETAEKAGTMPGITAKTPTTPALTAAEMATAGQVVDAALQLQKAFFLSWLPLGIYTLPKIPGAQVKESGDETDVEFTVQGVMNRAIFDKDLLLVHFVQQYPNGETVDQVPQFEKTPEGLLYTGTEAEVGLPGHHLTYNVEYQQVEQFRLPKTVAAIGTIAVHFRFQNCKVNPPAPPIHLRVVHVRPQ
jgi:hypothetical protein